MLINLRNALMAGKRLPYDAEVEYLESTGTQWIDTGIKGNQTTSAELLAAWRDITNDKPLFAADNGNTFAGAFNLSTWNGIRYVRGGISKTSSVSLSSDVVYDIACSPSGVSVNGVYDAIVSTPDFETNGTIPLFAWNRRGTIIIKSKCRIYSAKFYQNNLLVRDLIPVRKGTVGYLYDRVTRKLFGNAGTGDFVLGADVIDIAWVDGEYYGQNGSIGYNTNLARIDNYIAVTGGHSITWKWGDRVLGACYLIVYNAQKQQIDFWSPNSSAGERTINLNATGAFVRYSIGKNFKNTTFFKDNTTGLYAVRNGKILLP